MLWLWTTSCAHCYHLTTNLILFMFVCTFCCYIWCYIWCVLYLKGPIYYILPLSVSPDAWLWVYDNCPFWKWKCLDLCDFTWTVSFEIMVCIGTGRECCVLKRCLHTLLTQNLFHLKKYPTFHFSMSIFNVCEFMTITTAFFTIPFTRLYPFKCVNVCLCMCFFYICPSQLTEDDRSTHKLSL